MSVSGHVPCSSPPGSLSQVTERRRSGGRRETKGATQKNLVSLLRDLMVGRESKLKWDADINLESCGQKHSPPQWGGGEAVPWCCWVLLCFKK